MAEISKKVHGRRLSSVRFVFRSIRDTVTSTCTWSLPMLASAWPGFLLGGAPDRRHPALHQPRTRLKLSRTAGDLGALQHSAESWVEPQSEIKIAKQYR